MFLDNNVKFDDFKKIKLNVKGKLTIKKICKSKFILVILLSIIILIILAIITNSKIKKVNTIETELNAQKDRRQYFENSIEMLTTMMRNTQFNLQEQKKKSLDAQKELENLNQKKSNESNKNKGLMTKKQEIEQYIQNSRTYLKTSAHQEEFYKSQIEKLNKEVEELKEQYTKIIEEKNKKDSQETILGSQLITQNIKKSVETLSGGVIGSKCFNSEQGQNYDRQKFMANCHNRPLLFIIKTADDQRLGAFYSNMKEGVNHFIFNVEKGSVFWSLNDQQVVSFSDEYKIVSFSNDFKINIYQTMNSNFPDKFGNKGTNTLTDFVSQGLINIKILEVHEIEFKN